MTRKEYIDLLEGFIIDKDLWQVFVQEMEGKSYSAAKLEEVANREEDYT